MPPRRLRPEVPRDLETICLKCLQKDPRKRYTTAPALADDLRRFREGRPVAARPVGYAERLWRWCRRKPAVAALLSSLMCVFLAGFVGVVWQWRVAVAATEEKELQRQQAESARAWSDKLVYAGQIALAQREWQDNEVAHARQLLDDCRPELPVGSMPISAASFTAINKPCKGTRITSRVSPSARTADGS